MISHRRAICRSSRVPRVLCLLALLGALLSGCVQAPEENGESPPAPDPLGPVFADGSPAPLSDALSDCYEAIGSFSVPADAFADRVPAGFSVPGYSAVGTVPAEPTGSTAETSAVASQCHDGEGSVVNRLVVFLMVEPPEPWRNPAAEFGHLLLLSYFTDSDSHGELMTAWGFAPVLFVGAIDAERTVTPATRTSETAAGLAATTATLATNVVGLPVEMEGSTARFFATDEAGRLAAVADASFGSFDAMLGQASLTGSEDAGVYQAGLMQSGLGLHIWGHTNTWTHVPLAAEPATGG